MKITIKLYAVVALLSLYGFSQALACADCLLLCGRYVVVYALIKVVVCPLAKSTHIPPRNVHTTEDSLHTLKPDRNHIKTRVQRQHTV